MGSGVRRGELRTGRDLGTSSEGWHLGTAPQPCCAPHQTLPYLSLGEGSSEGGGRRRGMRSISCEITYCVMPSCHESPVVEGVMRYWGGGGATLCLRSSLFLLEPAESLLAPAQFPKHPCSPWCLCTMLPNPRPCLPSPHLVP